MSIYELFVKRDEAQASKYLNIYLAWNLLSPAEHAHALNFIGHAKTINPGYKEIDLFEKALVIYQSLEQTADVRLGEAFAYRYLSLMHHRRGNTEQAIAYAKRAVRIQKEFLVTVPDIKISLAESYHAWGVILTKQGKLEEALEKLYHAKELEDAFCKEKELDHFMKFTTMQSIASLWTRTGKAQDAIKLLDEAFAGQIKCFETDSHPDIAKTLHFKGDALFKLGQYTEALATYEASLAMKKSLKVGQDIIKVTEEAVVKTKLAQKNEVFKFDFNNYRTIPDENTVKETEDFIQQLLPFKNTLDPASKKSLSELCYKLGSYYNHIGINKDRARAPNRALELLLAAKELLQNQQEVRELQGWIDNHIAFSYQQKAFNAKRGFPNEDLKENLQKAEQYYDAVIHEFNPEPKTNPGLKKIFTFATCVKALTEYEKGNKEEAIRWYTLAIHIYKQINEQVRDANNSSPRNDQCYRALLRLAMIKGEVAKEKNNYNMRLLAEHDFREVLQYWNTNTEAKNPYAARAYFTYANYAKEAYPKNFNYCIQYYQKAYQCSINSDGANAEFTQEIKKRLDAVRAVQETKKDHKSAHSPTTMRRVDTPHPQRKKIQEQEPEVSLRKSR